MHSIADMREELYAFKHSTSVFNLRPPTRGQLTATHTSYDEEVTVSRSSLRVPGGMLSGSVSNFAGGRGPLDP
jgi:hypothetical protein